MTLRQRSKHWESNDYDKKTKTVEKTGTVGWDKPKTIIKEAFVAAMFISSIHIRFQSSTFWGTYIQNFRSCRKIC